MIVLSEWGLEANTVYMVPARNLVGRLRAYHVPEVTSPPRGFISQQMPGFSKITPSLRPVCSEHKAVVRVALFLDRRTYSVHRWFLAVLSESLPSRLLRRRRVPIVVAVLRSLQWANRLSSIRETLADRLLLCRLCLGDLYSLFVVKLFSRTGS